MGKKIRWGIIGCGAVTEQKSGPAFNLAPHTELVAVMRRNAALAKDYAARHGIKQYYTNADELIADHHVDAVYIASPPASHKEIALKVAAAGKPCCVEKPMALNYQECQVMQDAFAAKNLTLFVAYYRRSLPRFRQIKEWIDKDYLGKIRVVNWQLYKPPNHLDLARKNNWRTQPEISGGGYFVDLACHGINLFQWLVGDITAASGLTLNQQGLYPAEDAVTAQWIFANGALGSGCWNFAAYHREDKVSIIGEKGEIKFSVFMQEPIVLSAEKKNETLLIDHPKHIQYDHVANMSSHLLQQAIHPSLAADAAQTSWVMDCILNPSST